MKKKFHAAHGVENRWLLILPALALAMGCDSKADASKPPLPADSELTPEPREPAAVALPTAAEAEPAASEAAADATGKAASSASSPSAASSEGAAPAEGAAPPRVSTTPKAPEPVADAAPRRGPAVSGEGFNAWLEGKSSYALNQPATITVVLTATEPYKCNEEYPYRFTVTPNPGLGVGDAPLRGMNVSKQRSTMSIPIRPTAAGKHTLAGELSFSVCTEDKCLIEKKPLSLPFEVTGS